MCFCRRLISYHTLESTCDVGDLNTNNIESQPEELDRKSCVSGLRRTVETFDSLLVFISDFRSMLCLTLNGNWLIKKQNYEIL